MIHPIINEHKKLDYISFLEESLSSYVDISTTSDGIRKDTVKQTSYLLENNVWHIDFFMNIDYIRENIGDKTLTSKKIYFPENQPVLSLELKFVFYNKIFNEHWNLNSSFSTYAACLKKLILFIDDKYTGHISLMNLDSQRTKLKWQNWLESKNLSLSNINHSNHNGVEIISRSKYNTFLELVLNELYKKTDIRAEWDKDVWDVRNLTQYGMEYSKTQAHYFIKFGSINNMTFKKESKKYFKQKLMSKNKFGWGSAQSYIISISKFLNFISGIEPEWQNLSKLKRFHMLEYIEYLNLYSKANLTTSKSNPTRYIYYNLVHVKTFLFDLQRYEYKIAPSEYIFKLFIEGDTKIPITKRFNTDQHISDSVLEQLFNHLHNLSPAVQGVVIVMLKTGLRVSDALGLKHDCLIKLNGKYWIETDVTKTFIRGHRIPIDDETAAILTGLISKSKSDSDLISNPSKYVFLSSRSGKTGNPYTSKWIQVSLNRLARKNNIVDENGKVYFFKNHSFRHTYAVKLLNGGADILVVQELLAHVTPEMTLRYAKLLDDTKREVFEKVIEKGVFSFNKKGEIEQQSTSHSKDEVMDMLWMNHKLNAIDTPYGICLQRNSGKCKNALQPYCLTCNGGNPCNDLLIQPTDVVKYQVHMESAQKLIRVAEVNNKKDSVEANQKVYSLLNSIYKKIESDNIIFGNIDRLSRGSR